MLGLPHGRPLQRVCGHGQHSSWLRGPDRRISSLAISCPWPEITAVFASHRNATRIRGEEQLGGPIGQVYAPYPALDKLQASRYERSGFTGYPIESVVFAIFQLMFSRGQKHDFFGITAGGGPPPGRDQSAFRLISSCLYKSTLRRTQTIWVANDG
jgi:hypothetical protein